MKVLLVQSYLGPTEPPVFPLGLACLKAALTQHDVRVLDLNTCTDPSADPLGYLESTLASWTPDAIGLSIRNIDSTNKRLVVFYLDQLRPTVDAIRRRSQAPLIAGGSGFSMFAEEIMRAEPRLDFGVYLEGERALPALLAALDAPERVPSVYYRQGGAVRFSGPGTHAPLDGLPLPDRAVVPAAPYGRFRDAFGVETKRGCALHCLYCIYGFLNGTAYRLRDPVRVVDDVERLVAQPGVERFTFVDSVFNLPRDHASAICRELLRRRVRAPWSAWFSEAALDAEFLALALAAGCDHLIFSPDGFTDATLKALGKNITRRHILSACRLLRDAPGVEVSYNFFKNPPGQTLGGFLALIAFCVRARVTLGQRVHFEFSSMRIEPHTRLHDLAVREGFVTAGESLLRPKAYSQRRTRYIETLFDAALRLRGK